MTFKNISENSIINAGGRLLDPGSKITMDVEYYAKYKNFVDNYVTKKVGEIGGIEEYEAFIKDGGKKAPKVEEKVDLMEEEKAEQDAKEKAKKEADAKAEKEAADAEAAKEAEAKVEEVEKIEEAPEEAPKKKAPSRRKKPAAKKTDEA